MEKYYDLIVELVKSHRKYAEYASILDDIVDDVCNQAKTVLETIDNEAVVQSYLSKIVSTSMITVPKRMGIARSRQTNIVIPDKVEEIELDDDTIIDNYVEENIDTQNNPQETEYTEIEPELEEVYEEAPVIEDNTELNQTADLTPAEDIVDIQVDRDLVDKMINGVSSEDTGIVENYDNTDTEILDSELDLSIDTDSEEQPELEATSFEYDNLEELNPVTDETTEDLEVEDTTDDNTFDTDESPIETIDVTDTSLDNTEEAEDNFNIDDLKADDVNETSAILDTLYPVEDSTDTAIDDISSSDSLEPLETDSFELLSETSETIDDTELAPATLELTDEPETEATDLSEETSANSDFTPPSYTLFKFTCDKCDNNLDELVAEVKELDSKNPGKHILDICNAKYKDNKSVSEISESLNISVDTVIDALNEIVYLVKD